VQAFTRRAWRDVTVEGGGPLSAPAAVSGSLDAYGCGELMRRPLARFALVPAGFNGQSRAALAVDYVEVEVRYRTP